MDWLSAANLVGCERFWSGTSGAMLQLTCEIHDTPKIDPQVRQDQKACGGIGDITEG